MSNRQREAHAEKVEKRERWYPQLDGTMLDARMGMIAAVLGMLREELADLENPNTRHKQGGQAMRQAHLTITYFMLERQFLDYTHDLELINQTADIQRISTNLVRPDGSLLN